ncbi:hypothetical protein RHGRI_026142 [Rhododendron griersonianum]|uniref:Uncharacterized protein n=1 Tax=Rhododendron griersonianum TaxID=479676 RepID=A0AAV6IX40_9ERIC|nr:hypothetical protein RHGRI_026142 [Rhododendron griersonianum]
MASVSRRRPTTNERSGAGGKIVRGRQIAAARARTPYDRPVAAGDAPSPNPNWLTGLIFPTSRIIATGATKLFSSVFGPETSSSSSSSGTDSSSEDGMDDGNDDYDVPYDDGGRLDEWSGGCAMVALWSRRRRGSGGGGVEWWSGGVVVVVVVEVVVVVVVVVVQWRRRRRDSGGGGGLEWWWWWWWSGCKSGGGGGGMVVECKYTNSVKIK